jgi:hypothetical protein
MRIDRFEVHSFVLYELRLNGNFGQAAVSHAKRTLLHESVKILML